MLQTDHILCTVNWAQTNQGNAKEAIYLKYENQTLDGLHYESR